MTLNRELMTRWIEALESGRYRQGRHVLKVGDNNRTKYCCLGVLQKIEPSIPSQSDIFLNKSAVMKILGCNLNQKELSDMNDGAHAEPKSFREIAQYLRKKYKIG